MRFDRVRPDAIDAKDRRFHFSDPAEPHDLIDSIQTLGLLHPPILWEQSRGFCVVSGFRRIAACEILKKQSIPARILPGESPEAELAKLAVGDNSLHRPLTPLEQARAYQLLRPFYPDKTAFFKIAGHLNLPASPQYMERALALLSLPEPVQAGVAEGSVAFSLVPALARLSPEAAAALARWFAALAPSLSKQREILNLSREIALREDIPVDQLLAEPALRSLLEGAGPDRNQQLAALRRYLHQRRFPRLHAAQTRLEQQLKTLALGEDIQLTPPKDFESPEYRLTLRFRDQRQLEAARKKLAELWEHPILKAILDGPN